MKGTTDPKNRIIRRDGKFYAQVLSGRWPFRSWGDLSKIVIGSLPPRWEPCQFTTIEEARLALDDYWRVRRAKRGHYLEIVEEF